MSPRVSRTLLSFLADFNNVVVWIVLILSLVSNSSSFYFQTVWDHSKRTNYNWYHRHPLFRSFLSSLERFKNLSIFCFLLFSVLGPPECQSPLNDKFFFLVQFLEDHFSHSDMASFILLLCSFSAFASYEIK